MYLTEDYVANAKITNQISLEKVSTTEGLIVVLISVLE